VFVMDIAETISMFYRSGPLPAVPECFACLPDHVLRQIFKKSEGPSHSTKQWDKLAYASFEGQPAPSKMLLGKLEREFCGTQ